MEQNELPRLTVTAIEDALCIGRFDPSPYIDENSIACVITIEERSAWGRFVRVDRTANLCSFIPVETADISHFEVGRSYPYLDCYWGERAELVLDRQRSWQRTHCKPSDARRFKREDAIWMTPASSAGAEEGEIVKGGWDHEHCAICWETLGSGGQAEGFLSPPHTWVCGTW